MISVIKLDLPVTKSRTEIFFKNINNRIIVKIQDCLLNHLSIYRGQLHERIGLCQFVPSRSLAK